MVAAKQWVLKTLPVPGEPFNFEMGTKDCTFELVDKTLDESQLPSGGVLLETHYLSNDPAQKFWIASVDKNYARGVQPGEIIPARGLAKVIASKNPDFATGDYVSGNVGWTTHVLIPDVAKADLRKISMDNVDELWWHLSVFGATALTAYFIFYHYGELQEREEDYNKVFLISGAAGAVGTICIQIALHVFKAKKIIAIAGGAEKVKYVESFCGNDGRIVGVDYKDPNFSQNLQKAAGGPNTVDYFIDNVGGSILDLGVQLLKPLSMVIACGSISGYNDPSQFAFKNYSMVITKRLTIKGLLVTDNRPQFPQAFAKLQQMVRNKQIDVHNIATLKDGRADNFKQVPLIWHGLFKGINRGKLITQVHD